MITKEQVYSLAKKNKISETVIFREYLQLLFLNNLYAQKKSNGIFFKGGTALHLIYKAARFSEDLDFTVEIEEKDFSLFTEELFKNISKKENIAFKEKKSIVGKRFLLTSDNSVLSYKTFVSLDFSFREKVLEPKKSIIDTDFPIIFTSYVHHLSKEEIFAEKIRALLTRKKGRDLYDLWYLITQGCSFREDLVQKKLKYYQLENISKNDVYKRVKSFSERDFILDLRPFVPVDEREKLKDFFEYIQHFLEKKLE